VYVVDDTGTISAKPIRTGPMLYGYRVVRTGLTGDETIVIDGLVRVRPGVKVKAEQVSLPAEAKVAELPR
ncbi:efflux transporter periplasmic adaptor subunit, partial [Rhizobiaceae sp. 2RAB30]